MKFHRKRSFAVAVYVLKEVFSLPTPWKAKADFFSSRVIAAALGAAAVLLYQVLSCNHPPPTGPANVSLSVSGKITANNVPSKGVAVQLSGDKTASAVTDSLGGYSFTELGNGLYSIKP